MEILALISVVTSKLWQQPPPPSPVGYTWALSIFRAKGEGHFREWRCGGRSFSQPILKSSITWDMILKFRIDRRITGVRRGRKRVPICKGGVEVERGAGLLRNQTPSSVHSLFFFFCPTDRPTDPPSQDTG